VCEEAVVSLWLKACGTRTLKEMFTDTGSTTDQVRDIAGLVVCGGWLPDRKLHPRKGQSCIKLFSLKVS